MSETGKPQVCIVMGSTSDLPTMEAAIDMLKEFEIPYTVRVLSAHRTPNETLKLAEKSADEKIAELNNAKERIRRARVFYENKLKGERQMEAFFIKQYPQRVILLSDKLQEPTLDNLWNYHRHFYDQLPKEKRDEFSFEDLAGVYEQNGRSRLFATCIKYTEADGLKFLPQGNYLCADCTEETLAKTVEELTETAKSKYSAPPQFVLQLIVLSGILQWNYQVQVFIPQ